MWPVSIPINNSIKYIDTSPKRLERNRYKHRGLAVLQGAAARQCCICFVHFALVSLLVVSKNEPFQTSPSHFAAGGKSFRFSVNIFSHSRLARGPEFFFLYRGPTSRL